MIRVDSKEYEVKKAIMFALIENNELSQNKLFREPENKKYGNNTLIDYLRELEEEGTVQIEKMETGRKEHYIRLDPNVKNVIKQLLEKLEVETKATDELVKGCVSYFDAYEQDPSTYEKISNDIETKLLALLRNDITKWFESYFSVIFMNTSGSIPAVIGKYAMLNYELQLEKIEELLKKVKKAYPITYGLFLTYASGRFRLSV